MDKEQHGQRRPKVVEAVFAIWRRPWRLIATLAPQQLWVLLALGVVLAGMNGVFYLAIARLPLSTVGAIEFLGSFCWPRWGCAAGVTRWRWAWPWPASRR